MNPMIIQIVCVYLCVTFTSQEITKKESEKSKDYENGNIAKRKYERKSYKSKADIPEDYLDYLKNQYGIVDPPPRVPTYDDYDYENDYSREKHKDAKTDVEKQTDSTQADTTNSTDQESLIDIGVNDTLPSNNLTDSNETCKLCDLRDDDKQMRLDSIKQTILNKIGFSNSNLPNFTGKKIPRIPSIDRLMEQYDMQGDAPYGYHDDPLPEDEYYGQIHKAYTISDTPPDHFGVNVPGGCFFDIPESVTSRRITDASLWVYIEPPKHHDVKRVVEIQIYVVPVKVKSQNVFSGQRRYKKTSSYGWEEIKLTHIVHHWVKHQYANRGIVIQAIDKHGRNLAVSPAEDESETYRPMLEMSTVDKNDHHRSKRSYSNICSETERIETCCRYPLRVDFVQFGWDWVIAPTGYMANYCSGECRYRHVDNNPQAYLIQQTPNANGPCCTPSKMLPLAMLYFDHARTVLYTYMQKMIVIRCGCA